MELIENLPQEIRSVVRGFCSHPIADTLRPHMFDHKVYSDTLPIQQTYPDANPFYLYFFTNNKLVNVMTTLKQIQTLIGADVRVSEWALRSCGLCMSKPFPIILKSNQIHHSPFAIMRHGLK